MPRNDKQSVILRQWELLKLLPSRGTGRTASELTKELNNAGYNITKRQVERDLNELMEAFALDKNDSSIPHGWKWVLGASVDLPGMTLTEALSLRLVEETLKPLLPVSLWEGLDARFRQAEKQLAALSKENRKAKWASKVRTVTPTMPLVPPAIDSVVLATVQDALLADLQIEVDYRAMRDEESKIRRLHPLALVNRGSVTYLIAYTSEYDEVRLYALHRIRNATRTSDTVKRPADFDLDEYIQAGGLHFGNGKNIRLNAWVSQSLARILEETPLSKDQKLKIDEDGDWIRLSATVADSWQLIWWLMSQGSSIEVVAPVALRKKIGGLHAEAANQYSSEFARFQLTQKQDEKLKVWLAGVTQRAARMQEEGEGNQLGRIVKGIDSDSLTQEEISKMPTHEFVVNLEAQQGTHECQKPLSSLPRPLPYYGAIGGGISITFTPTGMGVYCRATEFITGESIDLTDDNNLCW